MAAIAAMQHNPLMRSFAASLQRRGKPFKVVITAVMRKLIVTLNAISAPASFGTTLNTLDNQHGR